MLFRVFPRHDRWRLGRLIIISIASIFSVGRINMDVKGIHDIYNSEIA